VIFSLNSLFQKSLTFDPARIPRSERGPSRAAGNHPSKIATARVQPAEARAIFTGTRRRTAARPRLGTSGNCAAIPT